MADHRGSNRFMEARNGDHLCNTFQCPTCHFRNIKHRDPLGWNLNDHELLEYIVRATLDAFWSRAPTTVAGNLREGLRGQRKFADKFDVCLVPSMGPFPLKDSCGMMQAVAILDRSLDPGVNDEFVQWDTFRNQRSFITNATQAGVSGLGDSVGAYERNRMWISNVVTHGFWFTRFMAGLHLRVGEIKKQDEPVTIEVLHAAEEILEKEWIRAVGLPAKRKAAEMGTWFIAGFCSGVRGEEMLLIELAGTSKSLENLLDPKCPYFIFVISGPTKGNQLSGTKFGIPVVATTEGTHLLPGKWVKRLCETMAQMGERRGRLFRRVMKPSHLYEFEFDFFAVLREVQATTNLIDKAADLTELYGILRSLRRGMTSHALNRHIGKELLNAMNRWGSEMNSGTGVARLDMPDTYSKLKSITPLILSISRAF